MMKLTALAFATLMLAGFAASQNIDVGALLNTVLGQDNAKQLIGSLPSGTCQDQANTFLKSCTLDLVQTTNLKDQPEKLATLVTIDSSKPLQIDGNALAEYVQNASPSGACCAAACTVAKLGCLCPDAPYNAMSNAFALNSGNGLENVMGKLVGACKSKQGKNFEAVMKSNQQYCSPDYGQNTASQWTC